MRTAGTAIVARPRRRRCFSSNIEALNASRVASYEAWADRAMVACIGAYCLAVWWPTRDLPYHWDSATFVIDAARDLRASGFHPLIATHSDFAHPPLFVALVALAWTLLGESRAVAHALVLPALPAAMLATYRLGVKVSDRAVGAAAAFLFGGVAVVLAEVGQVYMDLPVAALLAWGLLAWMSDRRAWASALFSAAALMKIPAPLTVPGALMLVLAASPGRRRDVRSWVALAVPFAVDALWLAYHAAVTGWVLWRPGRTVAAPHGILDRVEALATVVQWLLLGQCRWVVLVSAVLAAGLLRMKAVRSPGLPEISILIAPIVLGILLFATVGEFGLRYGIYLLPPYFVACLATVRGSLGRYGGLLLGLGSAALFAAFATTWHPKAERTASYVFRPDENLAYLDMITIGRKSAHWLETRHGDAEIYGAGPEAYELAEPWQGYVTRPLKFDECIHFEPHAGVEQLVVIHGYHPQQPLCRRIVEATAAVALTRFESNGKWLEVYRVPSP
jgi:hypothetical protein